MNIGKILVYLRRYDQSLPHLRDGLQGGSSLSWTDKDYDPVRKDPRFLALVAEEDRIKRETQAGNQRQGSQR